ncbi:MAG: M20 family metallo-hydrolase [Treponema sp.]|nr:M20 family metallo-hydrolase [Treponema sp.]
MTAHFEQLKKQIVDSERDMVALETVLTSHPALAPENGGTGELDKAEALIAWLTAQGFTNIERYDAPDNRAKNGIRPNIVVTIPGTSDAYRVWFMAHLDVVPVGKRELWDADPWTVVEKDGRLIGRGVEDNQQGLVSAVFAARAFLKTGTIPGHTVKLVFMADEEVGSTYGAKYLLAEHGDLFRSDDVILIPDGGDRMGESIEVAEKNILWLRLHVVGRQTHGSRPDEGNNACLAAADLTMRLHGLEQRFDRRDSLFTPDYSTFEPTMRLANVEGINIIPGEETFCMDCRVLPCYTIAAVLDAVQQECAAVEAQYGVKIDYTIPQQSESPATSVDAPVVQLLKEALKEAHGITAYTVGIGGGTVAADFRNHGIPAAVWSTLDEQAHQVNEYAVIRNMVNDAVTMAYMMDK